MHLPTLHIKCLMCMNDTYSNGENQKKLRTSPIIVYAPLMNMNPHFLLTKLNLHLKFNQISFQLVNLSKQGKTYFSEANNGRCPVTLSKHSYSRLKPLMRMCVCGGGGGRGGTYYCLFKPFEVLLCLLTSVELLAVGRRHNQHLLTINILLTYTKHIHFKYM